MAQMKQVPLSDIPPDEPPFILELTRMLKELEPETAIEITLSSDESFKDVRSMIETVRRRAQTGNLKPGYRISILSQRDKAGWWVLWVPAFKR